MECTTIKGFIELNRTTTKRYYHIIVLFASHFQFIFTAAKQ